MVTFTKKREAEKFAVARRKGFRDLKNKAKTEKRRKYLDKAIKSVKVRKSKRKHWKKPIYVVEGM